MTLTRGSLVWVDLGVGQGTEQRKRRPAIVVSNDAANHTAELLGQGVVSVVPLTTSQKKAYPFQVFIPQTLSGLPQDSIAQAEQVRAVDITRVSNAGAVLPKECMEQVTWALRLHLGLW
jgi:mRNA interferase MazF